MTPYQKAQSLIDKFSKYSDANGAKESSLILVNEIIGVLRDTAEQEVYEIWEIYYENVKREIERI